MKTSYTILRSLAWRNCLLIFILFVLCGCNQAGRTPTSTPKISLVNSPTDILTLGAQFLAKEIETRSGSSITPRVYHSGVLSGGKGIAEIEMCQQGSIEIHITTTAYLANLTPLASLVSLPFLFDNLDQVIALVSSGSSVLKDIVAELNQRNLHVIGWWPRGFRQLTNSQHAVKTVNDMKGLTLRVMNNPLYVDVINAFGANPVPMAWGEVYNALQLKTIDGQENAEDVIFSSRLYEAQEYMTVWDYSTDLEVILVNLQWWNGLSETQRTILQEAADAALTFEIDLLKKNTSELRKQLAAEGVEIFYLAEEEKEVFREKVQPVWEKYERIFTKSYLDSWVAEIDKF